MTLDSFNRADNAASLGNADTGETWVVVTPATAFGIIGNQAYASDTDQGGGTIRAAAVLDSGLSDCAVQVTIAVVGLFGSTKASGPRWRTDGTDFTGYQISGPTVSKGTGTGFTVVGSPLSPIPTTGDVVRVEMSGTTHRIYVNGTLIRTFTDSAWQTETHHGLSTADNQSPLVNRFENFSVTGLGGWTVGSVAF